VSGSISVSDTSSKQANGPTGQRANGQSGHEAVTA
jgi:hypothetical protein